MTYQLMINFLAENPITFLYLRKIIEFNFRTQKKIIKDVIKNIGTNKKVLDIGCGTGEFSGLFTQDDYNGIDISPRYINHAKKNSRGNFQVMNAMDLQFTDQSFDFILIMAILHHLDNTQAHKVISEAKRVLKTNGKILIIEDAKIKNLENSAVKFFQKFDKGDFIRTPENYKKLVDGDFNILKNWEFRNGGCVYCAILLENK